MLVREMHIAVREGIRNSPRKIELDDDRVDFHLNFVQKSYIRNRVTPRMTRSGVVEGFEVNQKNLGDLRTIITKNKSVDLYIDQEENLYKGFSPPGIMYLVSARASGIYQTDCSTFVYTPTTINVYAKKIPFPKTPEGSTNHYKSVTMNLTIPGKTITNYSVSGLTFYSREDRYLVVDDIIEHYRVQGVDLYWEDFDSSFVPSNFIIHNPGADVTASFSYDYNTSDTYTATVTSLWTGGFKAYTQAVEGTSHTSFNSSTRVIESEYLHKVLKDNEFTKTIKEDPVTTMYSNYIGGYGDDTFALNQAQIDYVAKPRNISLLFDRSCQLPEHTHEEIVDLAIKNILRSSEATFEKQTADIQLNK
jgi:hypothetical protein